MAKRHASALRQHRRSERARARNHQNKSRLRSGLRKIRTALAARKKDEVQALLGETLALIDRSATLRAIHRNTADRLKSRLALQTNALLK